MNTGTLILIAALAYLAYKQTSGGLMPASNASANSASNAPGAPAQTAITTLPTNDPVTGAPLTDEGQAAIIAQTAPSPIPTVPVINTTAAPVYTPVISAGTWLNAPPGAGAQVIHQQNLPNTGAEPPDSFPTPTPELLRAVAQYGSIERVIARAMQSYYNAGDWAQFYKLPVKHWSWYRLQQVPGARVPTPSQHSVDVNRLVTYNEYLDLLRSFDMLVVDRWGNLSSYSQPVRWH